MNIDDYGKFTEEIWFSKHQLDCAIFCTGCQNPNCGGHTRTENKICTCDQDPERSLAIMSFGLAGETGEVMEILKKRIRDGKFDKSMLVKELGDVAYYWARICRHFDLQPSEVLQANQDKLLDRKARGAMRGSGDNR